MLKWRLLTALALMVIVIGGTFTLPVSGFAIGCAIFTLAAGYEWCGVVKLNTITAQVCFLGSLILGMFFLYSRPELMIPLLVLSCLLWVFNSMWVISYQNGSRVWPKSGVAKGVLGVFILLTMWAAFIYLRRLGDIRGGMLILLCLLVVWGTDTFAYFAGKRFGKTPLISEVSPAKTWEGLWGALVCVLSILIVIFFVFAHLNVYLGVPLFLLFYLLVIVFFAAVMGDLFESMVKRFEGVKDSGNLLPGHGGILDRMDSLIAAMPFFALGCAVLGTTA
jgi:phosphatidate cytidylyltransferase